jgi:thiol-disulfide isomerase/thioredoxin
MARCLVGFRGEPPWGVPGSSQSALPSARLRPGVVGGPGTGSRAGIRTRSSTASGTMSRRRRRRRSPMRSSKSTATDQEDGEMSAGVGQDHGVRRHQGVAAGDLSVEGSMPSFDGATIWLNSEPLAPSGLRGRVVLVQFWTYTCINWLRTLPYIRAWARRYADHGLVVIGVHTPEFAFELIVVSGPAGSGKTRLLAEFAASARHCSSAHRQGTRGGRRSRCPVPVLRKERAGPGRRAGGRGAWHARPTRRSRRSWGSWADRDGACRR